jgi:hypothetical protein
MIPGVSQGLKELTAYLTPYKALGGGLYSNLVCTQLCLKGCLSMKPTTHWLYPTQNITFGGVIRKYKACALWRRYKHGGVSPTYE